MDRWYVEYITDLNPESLVENLTFTFTDGAAGRMSREEMLTHVATHGGGHRGAVGHIMAQVATAPPRGIFTVYLHISETERCERLQALTEASMQTQATVWAEGIKVFPTGMNNREPLDWHRGHSTQSS